MKMSKVKAWEGCVKIPVQQATDRPPPVTTRRGHFGEESAMSKQEKVEVDPAKSVDPPKDEAKAGERNKDAKMPLDAKTEMVRA